jgi:hypothetical protein
MRIDTDLLGTVRTSDAGADGPPATSGGTGAPTTRRPTGPEGVDQLRRSSQDVAPRPGVAMT